MATLSFMDKLNEEQLKYAAKVGTAAKAAGIPPQLAISIAYHESRLNPKIGNGTSGEIGLMQVKPSTGKMLGVSDEDLRDPDKNIATGIKYLKQALKAVDGDPALATIGYNAGIDSKAFTGGDIPESTKQYLKAMKGYGAYQKAPEDLVAAPPAAAAGAPPMDLSGAPEKDRRLGALVGAGVGGLGQGIAGLAQSVGKNIATGLGQSAPAGAAVEGALSDSPGQKWKVKTGYGAGSGNTVQDVSSAYQRKVGQGDVTGRMDKLWGPAQQGESPQLAQRLIDRANAKIPPKLTGLEAVTKLFTNLMESPVIKGAARVLGPLAGGASAGIDAVELAHEMSKPEDQRDLTKMILKGAGTVGGLGMMFPPTAPAGAALAGGSAAIQATRDPQNQEWINSQFQRLPQGIQPSNPMGDQFGP
jgi:hypothetical protein